ncbi:MAG: hypothetical protein D6755_06985 [Anaerolineae bacterium]|nr:MAG: hypothetical protein D6755_06985 [Anaerolineae bacterium]
MYPIVLGIHNIVRWIVVILGVIALVQAYRGWLGKQPWSESARKVQVFFSSAADTQLLLGLLLYFGLSHIVKGAFNDFGAAMGNAETRFFALEHAFYMLLAVVFIHVGTARSKKAETDADKYRQAAIWFTLAFLIVLLGMPWSRPLLPHF